MVREEPGGQSFKIIFTAGGCETGWMHYQQHSKSAVGGQGLIVTSWSVLLPLSVVEKFRLEGLSPYHTLAGGRIIGPPSDDHAAGVQVVGKISNY